MFEKVNPSHPDKLADRIAGAIVDLAYDIDERSKVAVEVLLGHGLCTVIIETSADLNEKEIKHAINRIAEDVKIKLIIVPQDEHLSKNQEATVKCGDNGIFKGTPVTAEQAKLTAYAKVLYNYYHSDGKYLIDGDKLIICQSNDDPEVAKDIIPDEAYVNPLGYWTGGTDVDTGATNRKLGSDMGDAVTGGGIHGKDLSKADVSVNIYCHLLAQKYNTTIVASCAIGDEVIYFRDIDDVIIEYKKYADVVSTAKTYINNIGGFESMAEWGLIR